jgi:spore maturation protein SpmA
MGAITGQLPEVTTAAWEACKTAVMSLALPLVGLMALWLGIMRIAEKSGLVALLARALRPILCWLFPEVPPNHPAMGSMVMNMAANILGLSNAATPLGLRAMQDLEKLNRNPGTATNAMCTFLAINTSSIQLIPATAIALLAAAGSKNPTAIIAPTFFATLVSTIAAVFIVKTLEKLPFFAVPKAEERPRSEETEAADAPADPAPPPLGAGARIFLIAALLGFAALFVSMTFFPAQFESMANSVRQFLHVGAKPFAFPQEWIAGRLWWERAMDTLSLLAIPMILTLFPLYAFGRKVAVYEEFVEGAKEAFQVAIRIIPYLVAILVAIGMFRAAGGIDVFTSLLKPVFEPLRFPPELFPLVLMRPLSGSGSTGIFAELIKTHGPDNFITQLGATIMGSSETTFYVLAVYFGSVAVRRTRHAVAAGLLADLVGVISAVVICNLFIAR